MIPYKKETNEAHARTQALTHARKYNESISNNSLFLSKMIVN